MRARAALGEIALGLGLIAVGAFWILTAAQLPLWDGFAPSSGFLPLIYGVLLVALAGAALLIEAGSADVPAEERDPVRRPFLVIAILAAGVAGIEPAGFAASMFVAMFVMFKAVERLPLLGSFLVSAGTAAVLTLVFRNWLGVPMPKGPWGF